MIKPLWNKNFTIITIGTIISMIGNTLSSFALSLMVNQYTRSTFAFAIYLIAYSLPRIIIPSIAGTYLDKKSRLKTIYSLDFFASFLFFVIFIVIKNGFFSYPFFLGLAMLLGSIDSIYSVAYDSLYPTLIAEGQFSKAYSISSMIYPLASMTLPLAVLLRDTVGIEIIFLFNAISFLVAAIFETKIKADESQIKSNVREESFFSQFKSGFSYIKMNPGLMVIVAYFFTNSLLQSSVSHTLELPYFDNNIELGAALYSVVNLSNVFGRFIGGMLHYRFKLPQNKKYNIAFSVYIIISFLHGFHLFFPKPLIVLSAFFIGLLSVTSFNIRISSTQTYVDNNYRARFNGTFQTITTVGMIIGQLFSGALGEIYDIRMIILICNLIVVVMTVLIVHNHRHHLKKVYNLEV